jgi:hypothetical protein
MGELNKNPIHNVFKEYRKMNLVNPYRFAPASLPFVSTWDTTKTSSGSSTSTQIKLPLNSSGTYNFTVQWGDGNSDIITAYNQTEVTHNYISSGTYVVTITGICNGFRFNNIGDRLKISSISTWGDLNLGNLGGYFYGCSNLNLTAVSDVLDLTGTISFLNAFRACSGLTTVNNMELWDMSSVITLETCFYQCTNFNHNITTWSLLALSSLNYTFAFALRFNQAIGIWNMPNLIIINRTFDNAIDFDQNIGSWNISKVTNATSFMSGKTAANFSATNLDAIYNGWSAQIVKPNLTITFGTAKYTSGGSAGKAILTGSPNNWTITDGGI